MQLEGNIEKDFKELSCERMDCIEMPQDRLQLDNESALYKSGEFIDQLRAY
jgi:hypothetical protein